MDRRRFLTIPVIVVLLSLTLSARSAYHDLSTTVMWGDVVDGETDGFLYTHALGDDNNGTDDEDGSISVISSMIYLDQPLVIPANTMVMIGIWMDWGQDGSWVAEDDVARVMEVSVQVRQI